MFKQFTTCDLVTVAIALDEEEQIILNDEERGS